MPRVARAVVPGVAYHITQRGNNSQDVFFVDCDRHRYLEILRTQSRRYGLQIDGYCLMTNHVHLLGVPERIDSLANAIGRTHFVYAQYINRLHGRSGHLWQARFYSCGMDEEHYWRALRYIEQNPVRARIIGRAWDYKWSSAAAHVTGRDPTGILDMTAGPTDSDREAWRAELVQAADHVLLDKIRRRTRTGRPLGTDSFVSRLETLLGRRLRALPRGRPPGRQEKR